MHQTHVSAIVRAGGRILGLGDLGANGMGIPVGKSLVYVAAGGLDPERVLPVALDVGCGDKELRESDRYAGERRERASGEEYDALVDAWHTACQVRERWHNNRVHTADSVSGLPARLGAHTPPSCGLPLIMLMWGESTWPELVTNRRCQRQRHA
jgi:malic enzyme